MDTQRSTSGTAPDSRHRVHPLTMILLAFLVLAGVVTTVIKLEQDRVRSAAFRELHQMGFTTSIGPGMSVRFVAEAFPQPANQIHKLPSLLADCTRAHDLGLSLGADFELLDLRGSGASDEIIGELKSRFPRTKILP